MTFRLRFWGTRGSVPSPGPTTVRYGGNTPCVEVRTDSNSLIILDAGTGIRELGRALIEGANGNGISAEIFLTHAHWDHIQGFPFFAPIFQAGNRFKIWGSKELKTSIDRVIRDQMLPVVFPVPFDALAAQISFAEISEERRDGNGYVVKAFGVCHPGGALGYRFSPSDGLGSSFVYISDNELREVESYRQRPEWQNELVRFVEGAQTLIHDATYTNDEYGRHRGWGHSTYEDAVGLAVRAGVRQLVLFHHKPERTDEDLDRYVAECQKLVAEHDATLTVIAAAEGMTLTV
jgi:phosphoribosyl 1,2-cyclic phosphodiesterase